MRIGIHSFVDGTNLEGAVQQVVKAEEEGFDSFWFGQTLDADVMTAIALAGQRTERIEIGVRSGGTGGNMLARPSVFSHDSR